MVLKAFITMICCKEELKVKGGFMKVKSLLCSVVLGFCALFGVLGLTGCKEVNLDTVTDNFLKLEEVYSANADVFKEGTCEGMATKYLIDYGTVVDGFVSENKDGYAELLTKYNAVLVISNDYIDNNKSYVMNLTDEKINADSKKSFKALNNSLLEYTESISDFVRARKSFMEYFAQFNGELGNEANEAHLRKFKKEYGNLVDKNLELSMSLAKSVESTEIFDLLKNTTPTQNDTKIVKEYIRAKMLPIFSEFMISEIENNLNWNAQVATETKTRIDQLLGKLNNSFEVYKARFVKSNENVKVLTNKEMNSLFEMVENFLVETDEYYKALKGLDISALAVQYDNNLENYKKTNKLAEVYLEKMEQFINITLPKFVEESLLVIY